MKWHSSQRLLLAAFTLTAVTVSFHVTLRLLIFARLFGSLGQRHSGVVISQREVALANGMIRHRDRATIPRIIHQISHDWDTDLGNGSLPVEWAAAQQSCIDLNPGWEHKLWTTETSRGFLQEHFSWFLSTYDAYRYPIQKVDSLRYFLLRHFGGVYLDLDNGCSESLDALIYYPAFTAEAGQGSLGTYIMGGQPGHPWFQLLTDNLIPWSWNWVFPYVIINYCSGKWFATALWEEYHALLSDNGRLRGFDGYKWGPLYRITMDPGLGNDSWVFFTQASGSTWQEKNWDNQAAVWMSRNPEAAVLGLFGVSALFVTCCAWCVLQRRRRRRVRYQELASKAT